MFNPLRFIPLRTRRARRGGALLLIVVWTMLWVSQAYAACCGMHAGRYHESMNPVMEIHAIVQSVDQRCSDPEEPCCPQTLDENLPVASAQPGILGNDRPAQPALLQRAPPMLFELQRAGIDRVPDSPGPPDRVYLRLQRLLI